VTARRRWVPPTRPASPDRSTGVAARSVLGLLVAAAFAACVSGAPSGSPGSSATPDPSGPVAKPTFWPTTTIEATIALGAADGEIWKAGVDLRLAADTEDVEAMWGAADGLVTLLDGILPNVPRLQAYDHLAPLGDQLERAYGALRAGAALVRDSITGGDPAGVVSGFEQLAVAMQLYGDARQGLSDAAGQAIFMKRTLVK